MPLERLAVLAEGLVIDHSGRDAWSRAHASPAASARWTPPARSRRDSLCALPPRSAPPCWSRGRRSGRRRACGPSASPCEIELAVIAHARLCPRPRTTSPRRTTVSPSRSSDRATASASCGADHRDHADAAIEGAQHFRHRRCRRSAASHLNTGSTGTLPEVDPRAGVLRQHARNVVGKSAAGDVRQRLDRAGLADRGEAGFDIDARRREHRLAERAARIERRGRVPAQPAVLAPPCAPAKSRWNARPDEARPSTTSPATTSGAAGSRRARPRRPQSRRDRSRRP